MELVLSEDKIKLLDRELSFSETVDKLSNLSARQMVEYFTNIGVKLPRVLNTSALRAFVLNEKVKIAKTLNLSDEMMYRLRFYPDFTEYQLQSFYHMTCDTSDFITYKQNLFKIILMNTTLLGISDEQVKALIDLESEPYEDFDTFEKTIMPIFYDFNKEFDGVKREVIINVVRKSATAQDIRDLGSKYGISIPKRLKRNQMQSIIEEGLRRLHKFTVEIKEKLDKLPIINLQRIAKQNSIKVSIDLKKEDLIAYLLEEVDKAGFETKPRLIYNTDLGDDFEFDLSYVMAVEEIDEFVSEQEREDNGTFDSVSLEVEDEKVEETISTIKEEKVERPTTVSESVEEKVFETETTSEVTPEPVAREVRTTETVYVTQNPTVDFEALAKSITDAIREVASKLSQPLKAEVNPIINIYNDNNDGKDASEDKEAETYDLNKYPYDNFDNQVSPLYNSMIADNMTAADANRFDQLLKEEEKAALACDEDKEEDKLRPPFPPYGAPHFMPGPPPGQPFPPQAPLGVQMPVTAPGNIQTPVVADQEKEEDSTQDSDASQEENKKGKKEKKKKLTHKERIENLKAHRARKIS